MAIHEEIIIDVQDNGMQSATDKATKLGGTLRKVSDESKEMAGSMRSSGNAVLENGGAMGLLNDLTGGYAMMAKDAVEASALFTRAKKVETVAEGAGNVQKQVATAQLKGMTLWQKAYTIAVGVSSGALKVFKIALAATGIGLLILGIAALVANFDKVKKAVMNLIPGLSAVADFIGGLVDAVTDFIGVTSDATRALDKMVENAEASLKKSEHFLEANGDKYDEYTQRKMKANIDYNKKVKEIAEDETLTEKEKLKRINDFREKANREIDRADKDRAEAQDKARKEQQDKIAEDNKKRADERKRIQDEEQRKKDEAIAKEKQRTDAIAKILEDYNKKTEDAAAKSNTEKLNLEEKRALAELDILKATEEEKQKVRDYYNGQRVQEEQRLQEELNQIERNKQEALRTLALDQKQWELDNETDPLLKLQKQREILEEQANIELEKLQKDIDNAKLSATERANAEAQYARVKQDLDQALSNNDNQIAEEQKARDEAVAKNRESVAMTTAKTLADLGGKGAEFAKGMAVSQAIQDTYASANAAYKAMVGIPVVGPGLAVAAAGAAVASGLINVKKILSAKAVDSGGSSAGGGGGAVPAAPAFNLVQGTGANQIAEAIGGQNQPIQAYVVSGNVTTAQSLDRNIVDNSTI